MHVVLSRAGRCYYRCERSATEAGYPKYPRLPVLRCPGFEPDDPQASDDARRAARGSDRRAGTPVGKRAGPR